MCFIRKYHSLIARATGCCTGDHARFYSFSSFSQVKVKPQKPIKEIREKLVRALTTKTIKRKCRLMTMMMNSKTTTLLLIHRSRSNVRWRKDIMHLKRSFIASDLTIAKSPPNRLSTKPMYRMPQVDEFYNKHVKNSADQSKQAIFDRLVPSHKQALVIGATCQQMLNIAKNRIKATLNPKSTTPARWNYSGAFKVSLLL